MPTLRDYLSTRFGSRNTLDTAVGALQETREDRILRYQLNWAYFLNRMYDEVVQGATTQSEAARRSKEILYHKIRPLFNVCGQAARLDAEGVFCPPVVVSAENKPIEIAIVDVWQRSNLQAELYRLVLWGAVYGDVFLRLANETTDPQIVVHPPTEFDVTMNPHDTTKIQSAELTYNFFDETNRLRTYRMLIYPDKYETYMDDTLWAYDDRGNSWENRLGFVPVVHCKLIDIGNNYGAATFSEVLPQIDSVNEIASQLAEIIRIHSEPQLIAYNVKKGSLTKGHDDKATTTVWYANQISGSDVVPRIELLEWSGNLGGMTEYIDWCKRNVEEQIPEWHIKRVREQNAPSGYSVELQLAELLLKLGSMRRQGVEGLRRINGMAMVASGRAREIEDVSHDITAGSFLPRDIPKDADLVYRDLGNGLIDRVEALVRRGYDQVEAKDLLARVDAEREAQLMAGAAWPEEQDGAANG